MGWFTKQDQRQQQQYHKRLQQTRQPSQTAVSMGQSEPERPTSTANESPTPVDVEEVSTADQEEDGVMVDRSAGKSNQMLSFEYDGEDTKGGYSKDYTDQPSTHVTQNEPQPQQNHLHSLFNGHLMKWKFEAEEGSSFIKIPAFFGSIALMTTSIVALVLYPDAWTSHSIVMSICVIIMAIFIAILDGRFLATNPLSARAHLRNVLTRNFNIFRYVWGRAILYMVAGVLNVAQLWLITICSGAFMIAVGIVALFVGIHASRKFAALRSSLADESFLLLAFSNFDGDGDGYLAPHEFTNLLTDLGMELDDRYTLKAFNVIDSDNDRRISFDEFNHWWASGYIERGRKRPSGDVYRRMD